MRSLFLTLLMISGSTILSAQQKQEITRREARQLVIAVLESNGYDIKSHKLDVEDEADRADFPGYFLFTAYTDSPNLLLSIGGYAISRNTADIWDWINCVNFRTRTVRALQKRLRRKMNLSAQDYSRLGKQRTFCLDPSQ